MKTQVRVRIAPSPTGDPHVGTAYIALFNQIFARHFHGQFILRIEDTDQTRSRPEYEKNILNALRWTGLVWDEGPDVGGPFGPYRQSERTSLYQKCAYQLVEEGKAYPCFCTAEELAIMRKTMAQKGGRGGYDRRHRNLSPAEVEARKKAGEPFVIRLKVPLHGMCTFEDAIKGPVQTPWADVDDQVLLKSDGFPTYHLANVVDDHFMQISHVIRGDEWLSSTPKHICLYEAFGWTPPVFMHMPLLLGKDGKKLSKRKNPTSIFYFRDAGYLPEALLNFLTLMGYSMTGEREMYSLDTIIQEFDANRIGKAGAFFDMQKLDWLNQKYIIETIPVDQLWNRIQEWGFHPQFLRDLMPLVHTRIRSFGEFLQLCNFFFINDLQLSAAQLLPKEIPAETTSCLLQCMIWALDEAESWAGPAFEAASHQVSTAFGVSHKKIVIPLLFMTVMGKKQGPPLFASVTLLGKDRTRIRLMHAIDLLGGLSSKTLTKLQQAWKQKECQEFNPLVGLPQ